MIRLKMEQIRRLKDLLLFSEPVEISDSTGTVVGLFVPAGSNGGKDLQAQLAAQANANQTVPPRRTEKGHTTREVFEGLKTLTQDPERLADLQKHIEILTERDRCDTP